MFRYNKYNNNNCKHDNNETETLDNYCDNHYSNDNDDATTSDTYFPGIEYKLEFWPILVKGKCDENRSVFHYQKFVNSSKTKI